MDDGKDAGAVNEASRAACPLDGAGQDPRRERREQVEQVLSDELMILLALLMVPIVLIPAVFTELSHDVNETIAMVDAAILAIFVLEYFLKLYLARDRWAHFESPWRLLDLLVITLPLLEVFDLYQTAISRRTPLLRLLRVLRFLAVGGRTVQRQASAPQAAAAEVMEVEPLTIRIVESDLRTIHEDRTLDDVRKGVVSPRQVWIDVSGVSGRDIDALSTALGISPLILESKLVEESYPRIDTWGKASTIFLRIGQLDRTAQSSPLRVVRQGILVYCSGSSIVTISRRRNESFDQILESTRSRMQEGRLVVEVLHSIVDIVVRSSREVSSGLECELIKLENVPVGKTSRTFLETAFLLKKEVSHFVNGLFHLKEVLTRVSAEKVPVDGFDDSYRPIFDLLLDDTIYLHETAQNMKEGVISVIDLHINDTSYELNNVMRVLAVITCIAAIPTIVGGFFGMNLYDNPWHLTLWQVAVVTLLAMLLLAYVFYKIGWLRSGSG